ncbi:metallophosphoesterase [Synechococcus sp. CS-1332]|uniref:metallophosphoesterase family protein n=1 Tax=Synechococcus sp. CS-1332 TaxID=2847972 RepID=UPI00223BA6CD|nr:metallophosphoesterase [Synechococcus sp. CS-1332]MCT0206376.1 metallophosphoesterase [Synechococcus sp. CS-1332]
MNLASEADIATKVGRMAERVRWGHPEMARRGIDPCRLAIEGDPDSPEAFSFLVLGDSGTGLHRRDTPQRRVAEQLLAHGADARFLLHTGDVVYQVGSSEQYPDNFIRPYREWIMGGEDWRRLPYDQLVFRVPFLPVLGNHDYYDLPLPLGLLAGLTAPPRRLLRSWLDLDVGWHGSFVGQAWAHAFLDVLSAVPEPGLGEHLSRTRSGSVDGADCLLYRPGVFTRLPHRYYTFRWAGVDVFALDSNTFNHPLPAGADDGELRRHRHQLDAKRADLLRSLGPLTSDEDARDDRASLAEQIDEQIRDIDKQLASSASARAGRTQAVDEAQLDWFTDSLIASWRNPAVRGRLLVLHHPPYVTEVSKWNQGQTLAVRAQLRRVLDRVAAALGDLPAGRPLLDLAFSGHAHCLELLNTGDTGHGDARIPWAICGGSGYSLRRQRPEGPELLEGPPGSERVVARSRLFLGRSGRGSALRRAYSALRVEVAAGIPLKLTLTPLVAEKVEGEWRPYRGAGIAL